MRLKITTPYYINGISGKDVPRICINAPRGGEIRSVGAVAPGGNFCALQSEGDYFSCLFANAGAGANTATFSIYQCHPNNFDPMFGGWIRAQIGAAVVIVAGAGGPQSYGPVAVTGTGIMIDLVMALGAAPVYMAYKWS